MPTTSNPTNAAAPDLREWLASFAENLTARARSGGQGDIYEREAEVDQVLQALASPLKGRVVVVGPARAGKTAVLQRAISRMAAGQCPPGLEDKEVWRLTPASLPGLATHGNWRMMLDQLFQLWAAQPNLILYIDEITRSARLPGGSDDDDDSPVDVATVIATALKRLPGRCLAEAEETAWHRFAEVYPDYEQLFLPVRVEPFELEQTRRVARRVAEDLGILHNVSVSAEALEQALDLSQRYALEKAQPGKTLDVLRDALAVARQQAGAQVTAEDVIKRFGEQSGLPRMLLDDAVPFDEAGVLKTFKQSVLGQEQAVEAIVQALSLLRARVHNPLRPMGVFLFLGPTGVGKTELARTLADYLYGNRDRLARFNMADYSHPSQASELFGNPYSNEVVGRRGRLSNRLAGRMFSVIVLDEFEKAARNIYQRFLQVFDEGLLINGNDEQVNLRNAIFILTSNFGARLIQSARIGFPAVETTEARDKRVLSETEAYFTPEFMNRMDAVCIFHPLNRAVMADIARREIGDLLRRDGLTRRQLEVEIDDEVIEQVVALGYSPAYGARYLKRQIEKTITYPVAREINARPGGAQGGTIRLYLKQGRVASAYLAPNSSALAAAVSAPPATLPAQTTPAEMRAALPVLAARVEALEELHGVAAAQAERETILAQMADVDFWANADEARRKLANYQEASSTVDVLGSLRQALDRLSVALGGAEAPANASAVGADGLSRDYKYLLAELPRLEFAAWLSGPHDAAGAYLLITARGKQTSARQWAASVARMYLGWARSRRLSANVVGEDHSPEGRSLTLVLSVGGFGVYGLLRGENGLHRLTQAVKIAGKESVQRLSASVRVLPDLTIDTLPSVPDLEITTRAISRGGLLVSRLTAQVNGRQLSSSLRQNLAGALPPDDLAAEVSRLLRIEVYLAGEAQPTATEAVRSYYRSTKDKGVYDHRTGQRSTRVKQILDGELQPMLDEYLRQQAERK